MLLQINNLSVSFVKEDREFNVVENLNMEVNKSEIIGLVGESGCGKTSLAFSIMSLLKKGEGKIRSGEILFNGKNLVNLDESALSQIRGNKISYIFQEPFLYLNPVMTIGRQLAETLMLHKKYSYKQALKVSIQMLQTLGILDAEEKVNLYPFELSGGQLQRVMIAMALGCESELIIADEPTTALDVSTQKQILDILLSLKKERGMSILFISHDLPLVSQFADRIAIMYCGRIVESGKTETVLSYPKHPYTKALLHSLELKSTWEYIPTIKGEIPNLSNKPEGCYFNSRCDKASEICFKNYPDKVMIKDEHFATCHHVDH